MLFALAVVSLGLSLLAFNALSARERRLMAGDAGLGDLAAWTGLTDRRRLLEIAGVRERRDGGLRFDPRFVDRLPAHPIPRAFDSHAGNGLCVTASIVALGFAGGLADGEAPNGLAGALVGAVLVYQLLGRLWSAAVWLELRTRQG